MIKGSHPKKYVLKNNNLRNILIILSVVFPFSIIVSSICSWYLYRRINNQAFCCCCASENNNLHSNNAIANYGRNDYRIPMDSNSNPKSAEMKSLLKKQADLFRTETLPTATASSPVLNGNYSQDKPSAPMMDGQ